MNLDQTVAAIVEQIKTLFAAEPGTGVAPIRSADSRVIGQTLTIDGMGPDKLQNICRLTLFQEGVAGFDEVARIEYQDEKLAGDTKFQAYSITKIKRQGDRFVMVENFLAESPEKVREEDFRLVTSGEYAYGTVLGTLKNWAAYRSGQLAAGRR